MRTAILLIFLLLSASPRAEVFPCQEELEVLSLPAEPVCVTAEPSRAYGWMAEDHRLQGTASYYSDFFDGRKTANGEIFRQSKFTAAHRTLPLGCWVEVRSLATGRTIRVKVNDRGPFKGGFTLDLSRTAARALGVNRAADRRVEITVLALPGEQPPTEHRAALE